MFVTPMWLLHSSPPVLPQTSNVIFQARGRDQHEAFLNVCLIQGLYISSYKHTLHNIVPVIRTKTDAWKQLWQRSEHFTAGANLTQGNRVLTIRRTVVILLLWTELQIDVRWVRGFKGLDYVTRLQGMPDGRRHFCGLASGKVQVRIQLFSSLNVLGFKCSSSA